jgi:hypothetical protein
VKRLIKPLRETLEHRTAMKQPCDSTAQAANHRRSRNTHDGGSTLQPSAYNTAPYLAYDASCESKKLQANGHSPSHSIIRRYKNQEVSTHEAKPQTLHLQAPPPKSAVPL